MTHVYVYGLYTQRVTEIVNQPINQLIRHYMFGGRPASESPCQVYTTLDKAIISMEKNLCGFTYNGNTHFDANGLCMVGRVIHPGVDTWMFIKKLWLDPEDQI